MIYRKVQHLYVGDVFMKGGQPFVVVQGYACYESGVVVLEARGCGHDYSGNICNQIEVLTYQFNDIVQTRRVPEKDNRDFELAVETLPSQRRPRTAMGRILSKLRS